MQENKQEKSLIKKNILAYLKQIDVTHYECYKNTGITRGILTQNNGISEENILKFISYYTSVDLRWLLTGQEISSIEIEKETKKYAENDVKRQVNEPCPNCAAMQAKIDKLNEDLIEAKNETIAALRGDKKEKPLTSYKAAR